MKIIELCGLDLFYLKDLRRSVWGEMVEMERYEAGGHYERYVQQPYNIRTTGE